MQVVQAFAAGRICYIKTPPLLGISSRAVRDGLEPWLSASMMRTSQHKPVICERIDSWS